MWEPRSLHRQVSHRTCSEPQGSRLPHLAKNERDMGHPSVRGRERSQGRIIFAWETANPVLPGGNSVPPLVGGSVQHVDTPGVHMLGHLEDSVEFVVQGRFASRTRQRIVTRSQSNFVCTHNEYWYTSARAPRKCANHTITRPRRGQPSIPTRSPPLVTSAGSPITRLRQRTAICNKTGGESARAADYQSGRGSPACKIAR